MTGRIEISLQRTALLLGVRGIEIHLDGEPVDTIGFGATRTISCPPGEHTVQLVLQALFFRRRSNRLAIVVPEGGGVAIMGRYSRMWGNLRLTAA